MNRNIRLLLQDIYLPIIYLKNFQNKKLFYWKEENKKEVLSLYRLMLKNIPKMQKSYLENRQVYEVIIKITN